MSRTLTAADRSALLRLASTMPVGDETRRAILTGLARVATKYYQTQESLDKYLKEHPKADKTKHKVAPTTGGDVQGYGVPHEKLVEAIKSWRKNPSRTSEERAGRRKVVKHVADTALAKFRKDPNKDKIIAKALKDYDDDDDQLIEIRTEVLRGTGITLDGDAEDQVYDYLMDEVNKMVVEHMEEAEKNKKKKG